MPLLQGTNETPQIIAINYLILDYSLQLSMQCPMDEF